MGIIFDGLSDKCRIKLNQVKFEWNKKITEVSSAGGRWLDVFGCWNETDSGTAFSKWNDGQQ